MVRNDKTKIILKGKPMRDGDGMYFTGYLEINGMLIGISVTQTSDGRIVYKGEKGPFMYCGVTAGKIDKSQQLIHRGGYKKSM